MLYEKPSASEVASKVLDMSNQMIHDEPYTIFVREITRAHRTLQQSVFELMLMTIKRWAEMYDEGSFDARNEATCKLSKGIIEAIDHQTTVPFI